MLTKIFFTILLFIITVECFIQEYQFVSEMNGYLELHRFSEKWQDARLRCHLEGGILASPTNPSEVSAMREILTTAKLSGPRIYTGIHATYSNGDFTTLTGIPLTKMDLDWELNEPSHFEERESCLIMSESGKLTDVECDTKHPYVCYKSIAKFHMHTCHPEYLYSDYRFDNRTGSCYKFHKVGKSWPEAFKTCMAEDAYLAIINNDLESTVIKQLFDKYPHNAIPGNDHKDAASIGFSMWKECGEWFTIHGELLAEAGFSTFNAGEPNNIDTSEWCGSVWRTGQLNDHNCHIILPFICEKSPQEIEQM